MARGKKSKRPMTPREAGHLGGEAVRDRYGTQHLAEIGHKGGESRARELGHEGYVELGRLGGEAVRDTHDEDYYAEIGRLGGETTLERYRRWRLHRSKESRDGS